MYATLNEADVNSVMPAFWAADFRVQMLDALNGNGPRKDAALSDILEAAISRSSKPLINQDEARTRLDDMAWRWGNMNKEEKRIALNSLRDIIFPAAAQRPAEKTHFQASAFPENVVLFQAPRQRGLAPSTSRPSPGIPAAASSAPAP